ncbi:MAG TPA: adenylate/guanylate cyclase domain-containing protein [Chthoniobacterales bacterium]|nr:adenylate/guanylate cyclase domain-containing protein [Chthoniobacterales bacterium]
MATDLEPDLQLEIAHVLFVDIVGYSKLLINEQREGLRELNQVIRGTDAFKVADLAGKLICLPTGDGMALAFTTTPDAPVRCAIQASKALADHPQLRVRMGVHSGPVSGTTDVNNRSNVAGAGINVAKRVMDCGDAGHILLSKRVGEDLAQYRHWQSYLHELGECEVKHGEMISLVNLYHDNVGNPATPTIIATSNRSTTAGFRPRDRMPKVFVAGALLIAVSGIAFKVFFSHSVASPEKRAAGSNDAQPASIPEKSIAVLPFENLSANQETAFFTDGVQDEILSDLAKVSDLKVISRTSVMQYKGRARNLRDIGRQLGVAHVVEGSVQRAGNRIRVNAQLVDARTDAHLWAQVYDRDLADVFTIQSEIARTIADQLQAKLSSEEQAALDLKPTENIAAYDLYLKATELGRNRASSIGSGGAEDAKHTIVLLNDAIKQDPGFLSAFCALAQNHLYLYWMNADQSEDHLGLAKQAIEAAARLQPNNAEVHLSRAVLYYWGARDYNSALRELALARRDLPNDTRVLFFTAMIQRRQNNWRDATRRLEQNLSLDPCNVTVISELAGTYGVLLRYPDAINTLDHALAWKPLDFYLGFLRADMDFLWKADLHRWHTLIESQAAKTADPNDVITAGIDLALKERDFPRADHLLQQGGGNEVDDNGFFTPREWKEAIVARNLGNESAAISKFESARERAASAVAQHPDDAKALIVLGQIDAMMGRKAEGLQEGRRAVELLPVSKDGVNGYQLLTRLIMIYAQAGEINLALDALESGAKNPYAPEYGSLKLDSVWDPLRGNSRFEKFVASLAPAN